MMMMITWYDIYDRSGERHGGGRRRQQQQQQQQQYRPKRIEMPNKAIMSDMISNQNVNETRKASFSNLANSGIQHTHTYTHAHTHSHVDDEISLVADTIAKELANQFTVDINFNDADFVRNFFGCFFKKFSAIVRIE